MAMKGRGLGYAEAGVDIDAGNRLVEMIKPLVRSTGAAGGGGRAEGCRQAGSAW